MDEELNTNLSESTTEEQIPAADVQSEELPEQTATSENVPALSEEEAARQAELEKLKVASAGERKKAYRTGSKVAAFVLYGISLVVFGFYLFFAITMLYAPLLNSPESLGEAIAEIFVYIIGLVFTLGIAVLQLPENIACTVLFGRLMKRTDKKKERKLFIAFFVLSLFMLVVTAGSLTAFFIIANVG